MKDEVQRRWRAAKRAVAAGFAPTPQAPALDQDTSSLPLSLASAEQLFERLEPTQVRKAFGPGARAQDQYLAQRRAEIERALQTPQPRLELLAEWTAANEVADRAAEATGRRLRRLGRVSRWFGVGVAILWVAGIGLHVLGELVSGGGVADAVTALLLSAVVLTPASLALFLAERSVQHYQANRVLAALIDWAVDRPGQLARGLPGWASRQRRNRLRRGGLNPLVSSLVIAPTMIFGRISVIFTVLLAVVVLQGQHWGLAAVLGAALAACAGIVVATRRLRRKELDMAAGAAALDHALYWLWEGHFQRASDGPRLELPEPIGKPVDSHVADGAESKNPQDEHQADPS